MRIGSNPQKKEGFINQKYNHRVIVVTYIPKIDGYYLKMLEVIKLSLSSLKQTIPSSTAITVVDNGSCHKVTEYLTSLKFEKKIDNLNLLGENIGKIDALIGTARGSREPLITLTDCDILFANQWVEETFKVFNNFKNVGSVSPIPVRIGYNFGTSSVLKNIIFKKLKFKFKSIPENFEPYNKYLDSINWDQETEISLMWPVVEANNEKAIIGSGHQILTIDRDILFGVTPSNPSYTLVGNNSELNYVDIPIEKSGKLRLSTYNNYAFHMGNKVEDWMVKIAEANEKITDKDINHHLDIIQKKDLFNSKTRNISYKLKKSIFKLLFKWFYLHK